MLAEGILEWEPHSIEYKVRDSSKAKNICLHFASGAGLVVTKPKYISIREALSVVHDKSSWVLKNYARHIEREQAKQESMDVSHGALWEIMGEELEIVHVQRPFKKAKVKLEGNQIQIHAHEFDKQECTEAVHKFFLKYAKRELVERAQALADHLGFRVNSFSVRNQKSRWGSCSTAGNINLNWKLLFVPLAVCDYIFVHELCHLEHHNHSKTFWSLVEEFDPEYKAHDKWLKVHGHKIIDMFE